MQLWEECNLASNERDDFFLLTAFSCSVLLSPDPVTHSVMAAHTPAPGFRCPLEECVDTLVLLLSCVRSGLPIINSHLYMYKILLIQQ